MRFLLTLLFSFIISNLFPQDSKYDVTNINADLFTDATAVIRSNKLHVELISKKNMKANFKRVVTILNENGNQHAQPYIGYSKGMTVKNVLVIIYDDKGNETKKIKQKDFVDVSAVEGGTLYSDSRVLYTGYVPTSYPYTMEFSYQINTDNTGVIPSWYFISDYMVSTEKSEFTISYGSEDLKPAIKEKNLNQIQYGFKETPNSINYFAQNIPAIKYEELGPALKKMTPQVMVRPINFHYEGYDAHINSWKDAGDWMHINILKNQDELDESTIRMVRSMVKDVNDDLEKAKVVYRYIQENTRYISVQVGIGGLKPEHAIEVDRLKYGDCKGLSNYTQALLKAVGVESYYVHVEAGQDKIDFEEDFADLGAGNHVILAIPYNDSYYWVDCTSQTTPFGFIGDFTDDRKVLVIKPEKSELVKTVAYVDDDNYKRTTSSYTINDRGGLNAEVNVISSGIKYDMHYGLMTLSKDDITDYYKNYWDTINNIEIRDYSFKNDKEAVLFEENVRVLASKYASLSEDRMIFTVNAFNNNQFVPKRYRNRKFPLEIQRGYVDEDEFKIHLPEGYLIDAMPENGEIENKFGNYSISFSREDYGLLMKRKLKIKKGLYAPNEYESYRKFRRQVSKYDNSKIILRRTTTP